MKKFGNIAWIAVAALAASCGSGGEHDEHEGAKEADGHFDWGYHGAADPEHWGELTPAFASCAWGRSQSPIDLSDDGVHEDRPITVAYGSEPLVLFNNGHTVQVNAEPGRVMNDGVRDYTLVQAHFHTPSEHAVDHVRFPLEAHFVHRREDGHLGVVSALFEEGPANPALQKVVDNLDFGPSEPHEVDGVTLDPRDLMPVSLSVYRYAGSLTTPPCTEGVAWYVLRDVQTASGAQIAALHEALGDNARPLQPINERLLVTPN